VASGTLTNPFQLRVFDLQFALSGQDLADLYPLLGIAIPPSPPYALNGRLKRDHNVWRYEQLHRQGRRQRPRWQPAVRSGTRAAADRHAGIQAPGLR
jgi:hypothetical protein